MRWIAAFLLGGFTLLMIKDFFLDLWPAMDVHKGIVFVTILLIIVCISYFSDPEKEVDWTLKWNVAMSIYLPLLIVLLSLLDGRSETGISMSDPLVLVLMAVSFLEVYKQLKQKRTSGKSQSQENRMWI